MHIQNNVILSIRGSVQPARNNLATVYYCSWGRLSALLFPLFSIALTKMAVLDYFSAVARKRPWQAVPVTKGEFVPGSEETIFRALAIRHLELPVKDMLLEGLKLDLPNSPGLLESIESNWQDEERHDLALGYVAAAHGLDEKAEAEAMKIRQAWIDHPAFPIAKEAILERCLLYASPSPRDKRQSRMPSSA